MRVIITLIITFLMAGAARADVFVLCYHSFLGRKNVPYDFTAEELRSHLQFLRERGFQFVTLKDIREGRVSGNKNILVTIDDGNHSVYRVYYDVFKPMGIKPLLSIYPNIINRQVYALTWDQLKKLSDDGCEIAAHGFFHLKINNTLYKERKSMFMQEIVKSKSVLEEKLGKKVDSFAYPFGLSTAIAEEVLRETGYKQAFTIVNNPVKTPLAGNPDQFKLPRYMLTRPQYQGSLNRIVSLSGRGTKTEIARHMPDKSESEPNGLLLTQSTRFSNAITERKNPTPVHKSGAREVRNDVRYGVDYRGAGTIDKHHPQGKKKKRDKHDRPKKEFSSLTSPDPHSRVIVIPEPKREDHSDQVSRYNREHAPSPRQTALQAKSDSAVQDGHRIHGAEPSPGGFKAHLLDLSNNVVTFYQRIIALKLQNATRLITRMLAYLHH